MHKLKRKRLNQARPKITFSQNKTKIWKIAFFFLLARYAYRYITIFLHILNNQPDPKISNANRINNTNLKVLQNKTKSRYFSLWPNRPNQYKNKKEKKGRFNICACDRESTLAVGGIDERRGSEKIENTEGDFLLFQESLRRIRRRCWLRENPRSSDHRRWWWSKGSDTSSNGLHFLALPLIHSDTLAHAEGSRGS